MNRMKLLANALMVCMLHLTAIAQIPDLEPKINITSLGKPLSVASDGYGQHVIYGPSSTLTHKLLDNTGNVIASHSNNLNVADAYSPVVNTHGGKVYVVMTNFAADRMKLRFSLDGGASWIPLPDHQIPPAQIVENASISAFTDDNGVHVVWSLPFSGADPSKKVHYIRYDQSLNAWVGYKEVTDVNSNGGAVAKVITSGNTAVVAFLDAKPFGPQPPYDDILTSRDLDVPTETWATFYHQIPETDPVNFTSLNLTRIASTIHAGLKSYSSGIGGGLRVLAERGLSSGWVINNYLGQGFDVAMGSSQGVLHTLSNRVEEIGFDQLDQSMELIRWPTGPTWALDHMLVPINSTYFYGEKLTTSQTGIYSFWTHGYFSPDIAHFLQRRPVGISGPISHNAFWTGNNWVSGRTDIEANVIVRIRSGAVTRILADQWVVVHANAALVCDGGSIIAEPGGEVIVQPGGIYVVCGTHEFLGPGACISTTGGTIQIPDEATLRVNNSGLLASFAPGTIELGNNATVIIESDGKLVWNANTNWTFGSNARVEIHGTVKVADGVTLNLPDNSQVYVYEGATFELGSGATISTTGKFHAIGSVESPVQFVKSPTAGENWQGITAMSGLLNGDLRLEHVAFENAVKAIHVETPLIAEIHSTSITNGGIGIEVVPNGGMGPGGPAPPTMVIENTTITNTPLGIVVDNFSDLLIDGCHLSLSEQGEEASRGISLVNSSPTILATTIEGFSKGIQGLSYSMPLLQNLVGGSGGYSIIQSNGVGAHFESESNAILGYDGDGGQNSFIANVNLHVVLRDKSIVYAIRNYWGAEEPDPRLFDVEEGSEFYYVPYLNSPPEGGAPFVESNGGDKGEDPSMNPTSPLVRLAIQMRLQGRYSEAMQTLKGIIRDPNRASDIKAMGNRTLAGNDTDDEQCITLGLLRQPAGNAPSVRSTARFDASERVPA